MNAPNPVLLLGVPFHPVSLSQCVEFVSARIRDKRPSFIATANLDFATQTAKDVELQEILLQADLVLCDGMPLVWSSHWVGAPLPERVAGSDLVWELFKQGDKDAWNLYLLGADDDTLNVVKTRLEREYSSLRVVGTHAPPHGSIHDFDSDAIAASIRKTSPDLLLVAMGCPKQEKWIAMHFQKTGAFVSIGIGASLDFVAGKFSRAPKWMQKTGLEWLYRMLQEPKRMVKRYGSDLIFFIKTVHRQRQNLRRLFIYQNRIREETLEHVNDSKLTRLPPEITASKIEKNEIRKIEPTDEMPHCIYDCSKVWLVDCTGLGFLACIHQRCSRLGGTLTLFRPSKAIKSLLRSVFLDRVFHIIDTQHELEVFLTRQSKNSSEVFILNSELAMTLNGDLRASRANDQFEEIETAWFNKPDARRLKLDLINVDFMDSTGLSCLIRTHKLVASRSESDLLILNANDNVRNVINLSKLDSVLHCQ
ncbi:MAG: WecB/TagA/CpsF family glycosyltransferase [Verrucomicrobiota bacterium]